MSQLDIVIPVYNEGDNIHGVLDSFVASIRTPFRLLICYDHDEDSTLAAIENYARRDQIDIELVKNEGKFAHGAVMSGFDASTAPFVMCFPADDTLTAKNIDAMVELAENGCDIVCASRFIQVDAWRMRRGSRRCWCVPPRLRCIIWRGCPPTTRQTV